MKCRYCEREYEAEAGSKFCSDGCFYAWGCMEEAEASREKEAPAAAEAPDSLVLDKPIGPTTVDLNYLDQLVVAALLDGDPVKPKHAVSKALTRGLIYKTSLMVIQNAFKDYASGKMTPGELINKISSQVKHV